MLHFLHKAVVKGGQLIFQDPVAWQRELEKLEAREVEVGIRKEFFRRTKAENRYYWGAIVRMVADEMGVIPDDAHELLKGVFLKVGVEHRGKRYEFVRSTASLSVPEFEGYCEKARLWALSELNCRIPLPNEVIIDEDNLI